MRTSSRRYKDASFMIVVAAVVAEKEEKEAVMVVFEVLMAPLKYNSDL